MQFNQLLAYVTILNKVRFIVAILKYNRNPLIFFITHFDFWLIDIMTCLAIFL